MKKISINKVFPKSKLVGKRDWGEERLLVLIPKVLSLKLLLMKKGKKGNLQFHHKKNECGYLISGKLRIKYDNGSGKLKTKTLTKGDYFYFPPGLVHQEKALSDCKIIEASSPHFNDRVRVEKKYGLTEIKGLPSTTKKEVLIR